MRIFVCSRLRGDVHKNVKRAQKLCLEVCREGHAPFAPHLFYTQFLDDELPEDRRAGINAGLKFLLACDEVWVDASNGVSHGMAAEIQHAIQYGLPVVFKWMAS